MNKIIWKLLLASPAIIGLSSAVSTGAIAKEAPATAEASQLNAAVPAAEPVAGLSEAQILAASVAEPVAEPVAAAPATAETIAANSIGAIEQPLSEVIAAPTAMPTELSTEATAAPATPTEAKELSAAAPETLPTAVLPAQAPAATAAAPSPQVSDLVLQTSQNPVPKTAELPAVPTTRTEVAQAVPNGMGGPIVPAAPQAQQAESSGAMSQVTSVSQLSDVQPTDWAFQALQSLVERYGCIAGYPDGTYRGNRALTRYEFAAGVNACLDQITKLIGSTGNFVTKDDLALLQRLQEEFAAELATLRGRIDSLEARTAELEANQFSTTTKLRGEVVFLASDTFGDGVGLRDDKTSTTLGYRVRLNFDTSFTGKDLLRTRLQALNIPNYGGSGVTGTNMTRLSIDGNSENAFTLDKVFYRFPAGNATVWIGPKGLNLDDIAPTTNPLADSANSTISRFGRYNPAIFRGPEGAGVGLNYNFGRTVRATVGYLASDGDAPNPADGRGVFDGSFSAIGQLNFGLGKAFDVGLSYVRKYNRAGDVNVVGGTGSSLANRPFGQLPTSSDNFGVQVNFKPSQRFQLGGWYGYTKAHQLRGRDNDATIQNAAITLALPDFGRRGNLLGFVFGMPPKVTDSDVRDSSGREVKNRDTSYHLEGFYRFQVNDFISVTPGVYVILNPEHNDNNDSIWVGVLRTTFSF